MKAPKRPDYPELVHLLPRLHNLINISGMVTLEPAEAEGIRTLGFHAQAGPWQVPPLPAHLVAGNPLLEPLGEDVDAFWHPRRDEHEPEPDKGIVENPPVEQVGLADTIGDQFSPPDTGIPDGSTNEHLAILAALERAGGRIAKRLLQKKLWRIKAEQFNHAIQSLVERGQIQAVGNMLIVQPVHQPDSHVFHRVPQPDKNVPRIESSLGPDGIAGSINGIRGGVPHAEHPEGK